ncbi:MAG: hypothetical protein ACQGVK_04165 [Myxococcota bacterium]
MDVNGEPDGMGNGEGDFDIVITTEDPDTSATYNLEGEDSLEDDCSGTDCDFKIRILDTNGNPSEHQRVRITYKDLANSPSELCPGSTAPCELSATTGLLMDFPVTDEEGSTCGTTSPKPKRPLKFRIKASQDITSQSSSLEVGTITVQTLRVDLDGADLACATEVDALEVGEQALFKYDNCECPLGNYDEYGVLITIDTDTSESDAVHMELDSLSQTSKVRFDLEACEGATSGCHDIDSADDTANLCYGNRC